MSDLLSAASLFLAVIGLLYSVWYGEITTAITLTAPKHSDDRGPVIRQAKTVYQTRACPLAMASATLAIVLLPDLVSVSWSAFDTVAQEGVGAIKRFDAVRTLFCAIAITSIGLAAHTLRLAWRTRARWKEFTK